VAGGGVLVAGIAKADDQDAVALLGDLAATAAAAKDRQGLIPAGIA
jgi:hypothetical protein